MTNVAERAEMPAPIPEDIYTGAKVLTRGDLQQEELGDAPASVRGSVLVESHD
jgi:hypothetical protein